MLGLNIFLSFFIFGDSPKDITISIVRPLHENANQTLLFYFKNESNYIIKADAFAYNSFGADEGCMCSYFIPPKSVFSEDFWFKAMKSYSPISYGGQNAPINKATYIIKQQYDLFPNYVLIKGEITDQMDGKILFSVKYPRWILSVGSYPHLLDDSHFWSHAFNIFIHDNFWTWIIAHQFRSEVSPPFLYLPITNNVDPIIEKSESAWVEKSYDVGGECFNTVTVPCTTEKNIAIKNCYSKYLKNKNSCLFKVNQRFNNCIISKPCDKK